MPSGILEECKVSQSGKGYRVKIGGQYYGASLKSQLNQHVGKTIDFQEENGFVGSWGIVTSALPTTMNAGSAPRPASASVGGDKGDRFYMPFVSNTVAHCIAAGLIKTPGDLNQWARAARDAAIALDAL